MTGALRIERLGPGDAAEVERAGELFDAPPDPGHTARFLAEPGHHLFLAYLDDQPVGFVTGVELVHPDKGVEMFLYELAVHDDARRRGIGTALVEALTDLAGELGCAGTWVLTDTDNAAALGTYRKAGAHAESEHVMLDLAPRSEGRSGLPVRSEGRSGLPPRAPTQE